jgi:hypothetical protein
VRLPEELWVRRSRERAELRLRFETRHADRNRRLLEYASDGPIVVPRFRLQSLPERLVEERETTAV